MRKLSNQRKKSELWKKFRTPRVKTWHSDILSSVLEHLIHRSQRAGRLQTHSKVAIMYMKVSPTLRTHSTLKEEHLALERRERQLSSSEFPLIIMRSSHQQISGEEDVKVAVERRVLEQNGFVHAVSDKLRRLLPFFSSIPMLFSFRSSPKSGLKSIPAFWLQHWLLYLS